MDSGGKPSTAQMVVLATSSALTAFFYAIYRNKAMTVTRLKVRLHRSFGLFPVVNVIISSAGSQKNFHRAGLERFTV